MAICYEMFHQRDALIAQLEHRYAQLHITQAQQRALLSIACFGN